MKKAAKAITRSPTSGDEPNKWVKLLAQITAHNKAVKSGEAQHPNIWNNPRHKVADYIAAICRLMIAEKQDKLPQQHEEMALCARVVGCSVEQLRSKDKKPERLLVMSALTAVTYAYHGGTLVKEPETPPSVRLKNAMHDGIDRSQVAPII